MQEPQTRDDSTPSIGTAGALAQRPAPTPQTHDEASTAVVVPIRCFDGALSRLAGVLGRQGCRDLMERMASRVVAAADDMAVHVVTDDNEVADWATGLGASVVPVGKPGLSAAAAAGVQRLAVAGVTRAVIAHGDLALARSLRPAVGPGMVIVPDAERDGSNVLCVPTSSGFRFSYGPGSFARHLVEAARVGLDATVVTDETLATDIDHPGDLLSLPHADRIALGLENPAPVP